ncbi:MAG TPA: efflux RND transporter periplasmic adaptor subunit [Tepidisphaeraceae bacterium]|jgi:membrane fusion protein (multidrug efflux system)|nr:efflux RND transporter periplasmic adaptor subunit [Tepidisphaeraceae bacterium]
MRTPLRPISISLLLGLVLSLSACDRQGEAKRATTPPPVPVILKPATVQQVQRSIEVVGTLWADEDVIISNKINGKVIGIYKDVGDRAQPGEPLAQLLRNDYELDRNQKESALQEVLTKLGIKEIPGSDFDPATLPTVRRAKLQAENSESRYNRGKQLHDNNPPLISDQDFADLRTAWDVAKTAYEVEVLMVRGLVSEAKTRQAELAIANQALDDTTVRVPRADYRAAEATLQQGGEASGSTTRPTDIHAAKSKRSYAIAARMANAGELVRAVTPMFRLIDDDPVKLRAPVPERYISELKVGQKVDVNVEAYPQTFRGEIARINPQIDPTNRTFQIEVLVPNEKHLLPPGAFARGLVQTRVDPQVVFVPLESVVSFAGVNKVFTVKDNKAVEIVVDLGVRRGNSVEVIKGVAPNDMVVVSGTSKLASGVPVAVQSPAP